MFLLLLCLVTVNVKAQVRIGGNAAPNAAAALGAALPPILTCAFTLTVPKQRNSKNIKKSTFFIFSFHFSIKIINICSHSVKFV